MTTVSSDIKFSPSSVDKTYIWLVIYMDNVNIEYIFVKYVNN